MLRLLVLVVAAAACQSAHVSRSASSPSRGIRNPLVLDAQSTLAGRYRFQDGTLRVQLDGQDVARTPLALEGEHALPPGAYDLYVHVHADDQAAGARELEVGVGDGLALLAYDTSMGSAWIGPVRLTSRVAASTLDLRGRGEVRLSHAWLVSAGTAPGAQVRPIVENRARAPLQTVWIDLPSQGATIAWFTPDMPIAARIRSSRSDGKRARVACRVLDLHHREVARHAFTVAYDGRSREERIPVPPAFGPYLLVFDVETAAARDVFQLSVARVSAPLHASNQLLGIHARGALPAALGAGWVRKWDAGGTELLWRNVEGTRGVFELPRPAPIAQRQLAVLEAPPAWASMDDDAAWLEYVRRVVREHRDVIDAWEIFNERYRQPDPTWVAAHVARVAATSRVIRAEDPTALVLTGGPPEEVAPGLGWWRALHEAGLFAHVDAASVHMYFGRGGMHPLDTDRAFHNYARQLRALIEKPIWDTESGIGPNESFYVGRDVTYGYWDSVGFHRYEAVPRELGAAMAARMMALHVWHRMPWFFYQGAASYGNHLALVDFDGAPLPLAVALAQTVKQLDGAQPDGELTLPEGLWGLRFRTQDRSIAVVWAANLTPTSSRQVRIDAGNVAWRDMFGNATATAPTSIGVAPIYLSGSRADVDRVLASVRL